MDTKILLITKKQEILCQSIIYRLEQERLEYVLMDDITNGIPDDITNIIYIAYDDEKEIEMRLSKTNLPIIVISRTKKLINNDNTFINYIITPLIDDETEYTTVQKEYLFRDGIYSIINDKVYGFINDESGMNKLIIDLSECKSEVKDWIFKFSSISETYAWLSKMNNRDVNEVERIVNFYHDKIYNDSSREINYLADKINNIKEGKRTTDIFICTKSELEIFKKNYFFRALIKDIPDTHGMYIIDRDILKKQDPFIYNKLLDGVAIYDDCVYIDTYDDEYSLGKVDCKKSTIDEYNQYYDYVIEKYGYQLKAGVDINGI
jgi:hypothetical protein